MALARSFRKCLGSVSQLTTVISSTASVSIVPKILEGPSSSQVRCYSWLFGPSTLHAQVTPTIFGQRTFTSSSLDAAQTTNSAQPIDTTASKPSEEEFVVDLSHENAPEDAGLIESFRARAGFSRRLDGRVQLHSPTGELVEVKLDGKVEGSLLMRDPSSGHVWYLCSENLKQIDLSNDQLVASLFGKPESNWFTLRRPLLALEADSKDTVHVKMGLLPFRSVFTLLKEGPPPATD